MRKKEKESVWHLKNLRCLQRWLSADTKKELQLQVGALLLIYPYKEKIHGKKHQGRDGALSPIHSFSNIIISLIKFYWRTCFVSLLLIEPLNCLARAKVWGIAALLMSSRVEHRTHLASDESSRGESTKSFSGLRDNSAPRLVGQGQWRSDTV